MLTIHEEKVDFEAKLAAWLIGAQKIITDHYIATGYGPNGQFGHLTIPQLSIEHGKKYIKIVRTDPQRSVHCFIDTTNGNILKAATWKAPELKNPRGNLFDATGGLGGMNVYGTNYLRGG